MFHDLDGDGTYDCLTSNPSTSSQKLVATHKGKYESCSKKFSSQPNGDFGEDPTLMYAALRLVSSGKGFQYALDAAELRTVSRTSD